MGQSLAIRIINILFYSLFAVSIVLGIVFFAVNKNEAPLLIWSYTLSIVAIGSAIIFAFAKMFESKKSIISSLIVFAIFGVLIAISYGLASGVVPTTATGELFDITSSVSRWTGTALYMLYTLLGISFISLIFTEIRGAFK